MNREKDILYQALPEIIFEGLREYLNALSPPKPVIYGYVIGYESGSLRSQAPMNGCKPILRRANVREDGVLVLDISPSEHGTTL